MAAIAQKSSTDALMDVDDDHQQFFRRTLSPFQIEKFTYMFNTFFDDANGDGLLQKEDIDALMGRLAKHRNLAKGDPKLQRIEDVLNAFYDCLVDQVKLEKGGSATARGFDSWTEALRAHKVDTSNITLNQWLNLWGRLCRGTAGMSGFPIWVQVLGDIFFDTIDQDQDGVLGFEEFKTYYKNLAGVKEAELDKVAKEGYRALTASNEYELNRGNYMFCFANFLLGRDIYGPGKYIFGVFDNREIEQAYKVKYNAEDDDED